MTKITLGIALLAIAAVGMGCAKREEPTQSTISAPPPATSKAAMPAAALADTPFEGEIVVTVKDESGQKLPASITYAIKGDKVRYAPASASVRAAYDMNAQHAYAIDDTQKAYRDLETKTGAAGAPKPATDAKVAKTGKTEKIAGLSCEDWTIDGGDEKADVCVAKGIAYFDFARDPKPGSVEPSWALALTKEKAFPMRVVVHDKAGKEQFRADASKVDRKKVDDALFQLPNGFKKTNLDVKSASLP